MSYFNCFALVLINYRQIKLFPVLKVKIYIKAFLILIFAFDLRIFSKHAFSHIMGI